MEHNTQNIPVHQKFDIEDGVQLFFERAPRQSAKLNKEIKAAYNGVQLDWRDSKTVNVYFTEEA